MKRFLCNILPALLLLPVLVSPGSAFTPPYTHVESGYQFFFPGGGGDLFFNVTSSTGAGGNFSQSQMQWWNPYLNDGQGAWVGGPWNIAASASASFGHLSLSASSNLTGLSDDNYTNRGAKVMTTASFGDALTITTPGNEEAVLKFTLKVTGNVFVSNASNNSYAALQLDSGGFSTQVGGNQTINVSYPYSYSFTSGVPFNIQLSLVATAADTGGLNNSYAASDFPGSAGLNFIGVFDLSGNPITNFTFSSLSGANYGIKAASLPFLPLLLLD